MKTQTQTQTKYIVDSFCLLRVLKIKLLEMIVFVSATHFDTLHIEEWWR